MADEIIERQQRCPRCGKNHPPSVNCADAVGSDDISGGSSVFVFKDEEKPKRRRTTKPAKQPVVRPQKPRAQPAAKLGTKRVPATVSPPAPQKSERRGPASPADCTLTTEGSARVKTIGDDKLVFETKSGTVTVPTPCRETTIQPSTKTP